MIARSFGGQPIFWRILKSPQRQKLWWGPRRRGTMAAAALDTSPAADGGRRSCPLWTSWLWSHAVTRGRLAKQGSADGSRWPERRLCQLCSEQRCRDSCCNHYGHPCSCTGWLFWHLSCLGGCDLAPSTGRGALEAVARWFAPHASKRPAGYRPSLVPCHRRDRWWLCWALPVSACCQAPLWLATQAGHWGQCLWRCSGLSRAWDNAPPNATAACSDQWWPSQSLIWAGLFWCQWFLVMAGSRSLWPGMGCLWGAEPLNRRKTRTDLSTSLLPISYK